MAMIGDDLQPPHPAQLAHAKGYGPIKGRLYIARHGETVFNAAKRLQGDHIHTPLTSSGFAQASKMGKALAGALGLQPDIDLWASDTGRALQTLALICEQIDRDWHQARTCKRLVEIDTGDWGGQYYADVAKRDGSIVDSEHGLLKVAPNGETYHDIAQRCTSWLAEHSGDGRDKLIIMHGISSRVLRGVLLGGAILPAYGVPIAPGLPQGSVVKIENGQEDIIVTGTGGQRA